MLAFSFLVPFAVCVVWQMVLFAVILLCSKKGTDLFQNSKAVFVMLALPVIAYTAIALFCGGGDGWYVASCIISFVVSILIPVLGIRASGSSAGLKIEALCLLVFSIISLVLCFIPRPQAWMSNLAQVCSAASVVSALATLYLSSK